MKAKRRSQGGSGRHGKKKKMDAGMSPNVIALIHDRIHELNVILGRHVFLGHRHRLKQDLLWLIDNCQWLLPLVKEEEWHFINDIRYVIDKLRVFRDDVMEERNPISLVSPARSDRFATLLSHLTHLFPSGCEDELILGEMRGRVFHLQRHWTLMRNAIRQVNDGEGLSDIREIIEGMGGAATVKEWTAREDAIAVD